MTKFKFYWQIIVLFVLISKSCLSQNLFTKGFFFMKRITILLSTILLFTGLTEKAGAQYYFFNNRFYDNPLTFEIGGSVGVINCLTDIGGNKGVGKKFIKDLNLGKTNFAGSLYLGANYKYAITLRAEATFGQVSADDKVLKKVKTTTFGRYDRNLSFRSNITEFMVAAEFHPFYILNSYDEDHEGEPPLFSPYLLAGLGFFSFNPQAQYNGKWIDLQPLRTEGQGFTQYPDRKPYSLNQTNIPLGIGVRYELGSAFNIRAELVYRILHTDYLDDVSTTYIDPVNFSLNGFSGNKLTNALILNDRKKELDPANFSMEGDQRGNPKNNDSYFSFNIKIGYIIGREPIKR